MVVWTQVDFCNLPEPVAQLFAAAGERSFFARAEWYDLVMRFARDAGTEPRVYLDDARRVALVCRTDGIGALHSVANAFSVEYGPVLPDGSEHGLQAASQLAAEIAAEDPRRATVRLTALDVADGSHTAVCDGFRAARWLVRPFFDFGTWFEDTRGLDFRSYFDARPGILRNTYLRKSKSSGARLDYFFDGETDVESLIRDYEAVYRQSWKTAERYPEFIPEVIRLAARLGALRMGVLHADGSPAAAQFWIVWRGRAVIYKLAHDQRYDRLSLGTLLTMRLIERVLERDRPDEINFGRGDDPYKKLWLPQRRERWGLIAANPRTWRGFLLGIRSLAAGFRDRMLYRDRQTAVVSPPTDIPSSRS